MTDWVEHLRALVRRCLPSDARVIHLPRDGDLVFAISWKLHTDPNRPAKRSKTIRLKIEEGAFQHYLEVSGATRQEIDERLEQSLRQELSTFDPDHQALQGHEVPVVNWEVTTVVMG